MVSSTGARFGANLIAAISAQGELRFMLTKGRVTAAVFIEFLRRLLVNATKPILVIVEGIRHTEPVGREVRGRTSGHAGAVLPAALRGS